MRLSRGQEIGAAGRQYASQLTTAPGAAELEKFRPGWQPQEDHRRQVRMALAGSGIRLAKSHHAANFRKQISSRHRRPVVPAVQAERLKRAHAHA